MAEDLEKPQEKKPHKVLADYLKDPEFRAKHLQKMREKIPCECGLPINRSNMSKHRKTSKHARFMNILEPPTRDQLEIEANRLVEKLGLFALIPLLNVLEKEREKERKA